MIHQIIKITLALLMLVFPMASCSAAERPSTQKAQELVSSLREVESIRFYFLDRTEEWNYTAAEIISNASITVHRKCGGDCHNFMEPVVAHLRNAKAVKCMPGQQDALIRGKSGHDLIYSYSGRLVRYGNQCFFNEQGIEKVVAGTSMLFL